MEVALRPHTVARHGLNSSLGAFHGSAIGHPRMGSVSPGIGSDRPASGRGRRADRLASDRRCLVPGRGPARRRVAVMRVIVAVTITVACATLASGVPSVANAQAGGPGGGRGGRSSDNNSTPLNAPDPHVVAMAKLSIADPEDPIPMILADRHE